MEYMLNDLVDSLNTHKHKIEICDLANLMEMEYTNLDTWIEVSLDNRSEFTYRWLLQSQVVQSVEMNSNLDAVMKSHYGMRTVLYLLNARDTKHFNKDQIAFLASGDNNSIRNDFKIFENS
uniref:CPL domain-containing protein n=1 Tax=Romanomermis culicivorax TaxID=13658 RepID=A0A915IQL5_ROMCU